MYSSRVRSQWLVIFFLILTITAVIGQTAYTVFGALNTAVSDRAVEESPVP